MLKDLIFRNTDFYTGRQKTAVVNANSIREEIENMEDKEIIEVFGEAWDALKKLEKIDDTLNGRD